MVTGELSDSFGGYRSRLVDALRARGIRDLAVLRAVAETPRHVFVPEALRHRAYDDAALPIGNGQTISQPSTQAAYLQALGLGGRERVLEVGTGSGYQTALLAKLADLVVSLERVRTLADRARRALEQAGVTNVSVYLADGTLGWKPQAPYDAVLVAAASPQVPDPLLQQLAVGGRLVIPLVRRGRQELVRITRTAAGVAEEPLGEANFVPLVGRYGFASDGAGDRGTQGPHES